jgi:hypothetical protein
MSTAYSSGVHRMVQWCILQVWSAVALPVCKPERLQSLSTTLYNFNGTIKNLQTHLEIHEDDQARLDTLTYLQEPLMRCREALQLLSSQMQRDGLFALYIMGLRFDKKVDLCLRVLNDAKGLLELALQCDQRYVQYTEKVT